MQAGGWSSRWQGFEGNPIWSGDNKKNSNASSIVDGLKGLNQKVFFHLSVVQYGLSQLYNFYWHDWNSHWKRKISLKSQDTQKKHELQEHSNFISSRWISLCLICRRCKHSVLSKSNHFWRWWMHLGTKHLLSTNSTKNSWSCFQWFREKCCDSHQRTRQKYSIGNSSSFRKTNDNWRSFDRIIRLIERIFTRNFRRARYCWCNLRKLCHET